MRRWLVALFFFIVLLLVLWKPILSAGKITLLITQEFPKIPVKPLNLLSKEPKVESVEFGKEDNKILGRLFLPQNSEKYPAVILAMGLKTDDEGEKPLLSVSRSLARLGYVVLWPISEKVDKWEKKLEEPEVFVESFKYLKNHPLVDKEKISFFGISIGASIALVAAEDEQISDEVYAFVSFGGYYRLVDYLASVGNKKMIVEGRLQDWQPSESAIRHIKEALVEFVDEDEREVLRRIFLEGEDLSEQKKQKLSDKAKLFLKFFELKSPQDFEKFMKEIDKEGLHDIKRLSPDEKISNFKARMFILHDRADTSVPYVESRKLNQALGDRVETTYHESALFAHVRPEKGFSLQTLQEFIDIFFFGHQIFMFI